MLTGSASQLVRAQHVLSPHQVPCFSTTQPRQLKYKPTRTAHRINSSQGGQSGSVSVTAREDESEEAALQRRLRESARVEERVIQIYNEKEFQQQLEEAGDNLVVLEVESTELCQTGFDEPEYHWKEDKEASLVPCRKLKHVLQRTARDSPDVKFVTLEASTEEGQQACESMKIGVIPTIQFWKNKQLLWEHRGVSQLDQDLSEGILFYGDQAGNGLKASDFITYLHSKEDLQKFVNSQPTNVLTIVDVSLQNAGACVRIFPAVLALAKNFTGFAHFARIIADESDSTHDVIKDYNVVEVPTFLFFRDGKNVGRHVGSSRADLIGHILQQQKNAGVAPPTTGQGPSQSRRQKIVRRV